MCNQCNKDHKQPSMTRDAIAMRKKRLKKSPQHPVKSWSPVKTCSKCGETRNRSKFTERSNGGSNGVVCNNCKVDYRNSVGGRANHLCSGAKTRSAKKGLDFDITREWLSDRLERGVCEVTGLALELDGGKLNGGYRPYTPSLDRTDPTKGYTMDNTKVVCWIYNAAKGSGSHEDVLNLVEALINV